MLNTLRRSALAALLYEVVAWRLLGAVVARLVPVRARAT